jgi:N-acetylneuraminate lyase
MAGMTLGADGGVGTTFNFMASVIRKVLDSKDKGDIFEARLYQYRTQQTCKVMNKYGKTFTHDILHVFKGQFAFSKS